MVIYNFSAGSWDSKMSYLNGSFISAATLISLSLLSVLTQFGTFNIFTFYFGRKVKENGHKEDLYEYSERKKESRKKYNFVFIPYLFFGLVFLIISLALYAQI